MDENSDQPIEVSIQRLFEILDLLFRLEESLLTEAMPKRPLKLPLMPLDGSWKK